MPVRRSIEDLPAAQKPARPPSRNILLVDRLARRWAELNAHNEYLPAIPGRRYRASSAALRCDRQQFYSLTNVERSNPDTIADTWRMALGSMVHDQLAETMDSLGDGWRSEVIVDLAPIGVDGSAHADLVQFVCRHCDAPILMEDAPDDEQATTIVCQCSDRCASHDVFEIDRTAKGEHTWSPNHERAALVGELKTVNGFSFKTKATTFKGPPEGPQYAHIIQGAIAADALGCDSVIVGYLSMELVSPSLASAYCDDETGRFAAEWHFSVRQMRSVLDTEYARINRLMRAADANVMPARELYTDDIPSGAFIINPSTGAWRAGDVAGSTWFCNYCGWKDQCINDGADGATPVEVSL